LYINVKEAGKEKGRLCVGKSRTYHLFVCRSVPTYSRLKGLSGFLAVNEHAVFVVVLLDVVESILVIIKRQPFEEPI
jgi:hypothetical protein